MQWYIMPVRAVTVADSRNVLISDNTFTNFRYDVPRPDPDHYVIGVNLGARDAVIAHNRFEARHPGRDVFVQATETVFVLLSADVSQGCVVTHNHMAASSVLGRSHGTRAASNTRVTVAHNSIRNMNYGICVGRDATAAAGFNHFSVDAPAAGAPTTRPYGIYAPAAKKILMIDNETRGQVGDDILPAESRKKQ
jgi:hypothetical protein